MKRILIDCKTAVKRIAVTEDGKLTDLFFDSGENKTLVGNIYAARVASVKKGIQAAFVDIGEGKNAYLYYGAKKSEKDAEPVKLKEGETVIAQVQKDAVGAKGAVVSQNISLAGRFCVLLPNESGVGVSKKISDAQKREEIRMLAQSLLPDGFGLIARTEGERRTKEEFQSEISRLISLWNDISKKGEFAKPPTLLYSDDDFKILKDIDYADCITVNDKDEYDRVVEFTKNYPEFSAKTEFYEGKIPLFEQYYIESKVQKVFDKKVWLKSGGFIVIEQTEACVVIDVNTGKFTGLNDIESVFLKTNLEAAEEIALQLRLRNLSGIIIIDFIDMKNDEYRNEVKERLEKAVARDKIKTVVVGMTELGLMQLTRKKTAPPITAIATKKCFCCDGSGRAFSAEFVISEIQRKAQAMLAMDANRDVNAYCGSYIRKKIDENYAEYFKKLGEQYNKKINFITDERETKVEFAKEDGL